MGCARGESRHIRSPCPRPTLNVGEWDEVIDVSIHFDTDEAGLESLGGAPPGPLFVLGDSVLNRLRGPASVGTTG